MNSSAYTSRMPVINEEEERQRMLSGLASIMPPINPQTIQLLNYAASTQFEKELIQESMTELDSNLDIQVYYKCNIIIQDYELLHNVTDAIIALALDNNSVIRTRHAAFVRSMLLITVEKNSDCRTEVGNILDELLSRNVISMTAITQGFDAVLMKWKEGLFVGRSVPFFNFISSIIAPMLLSKTASFNFNNLMDACLCIRLTHSAVFFSEILQTILCPKESSKDEEEYITDIFWMYDKWRMSKYVTLDLFMPNSSILKYFKNDRTGIFILCVIFCDKLKQADGGTQTLYEDMVTWLNVNIKYKVKSCSYFVRALTMAIIIVRFKPNYPFRDFFDDVHTKLLTDCIKNFSNIPHELQAREFECLNGIQLIASSLGYPKGMLFHLFNKLYDDNVINKKSFIIWKKNKPWMSFLIQKKR